ncbi:MAG: hypothetical protein AAB512_00520 [Patescibacteria group bacterium]
MIDPLSSPFLVRGTITQKDNGVLVIHFEKSSALWDQSDIGVIGSDLRIIGDNKYDEFNIGEKITAKGSLDYKGTVKATDIYPTKFEPFGIDWKLTALFIVTILAVLIIVGLYKLIMNFRLLEKTRSLK